MWYRSLYWRIGVGFVALLATLLLVQALLFMYMTGPIDGLLPIRSPSRFATVIASDLSEALTRDPKLQIDTYVREQFAHVYMPFVVFMDDGRVASNREGPPGGRGGRGRGRLPGGRFGEGRAGQATGQSPGPGSEPGPAASPSFQGSRPAGDPGATNSLRGQPPRPAGARGDAPPPEGLRPPPNDPTIGGTALIVVGGKRVGRVAVSNRSPELARLVRQLGPTLGLVGIILLVAGTTVASLVIFRPARQRMRNLEEAATALGAGRTSVRAPETGSDEVTALARAFNRMAAALEASDAARRRLLADVSHELKTPLTAMRGFLETLCMDEVPLDDETRRRYLRIVAEEAQKFETMIGDLLDLARLEAGGGTLELRPVAVERLFARVADRHERAFREKRVTLETHVEPGAAEIQGDAGRLEQVLQNLATNALRHTPEGGRIAFRSEAMDGRVRIAVADSGPGIPVEHLPRVFDRFYKVEASRASGPAETGSGLGLSIVKTIVERHGGTATARNGESGGAVFELVLPRGEGT